VASGSGDEGPGLQKLWWIRATRRIRCVPMHCINRQARLNHANPVLFTLSVNGEKGVRALGRFVGATGG
jgi:hypothetical protein